MVFGFSMALFTSSELIKCLLLLPRDQALLETDAPHGTPPKFLNFGQRVTRLPAGGCIWPLTLWASTILGVTPDDLQASHKAIFQRMYGKDFDATIIDVDEDDDY